MFAIYEKLKLRKKFFVTYNQTSPYRYLYNTNTFLLWTVHLGGGGILRLVNDGDDRMEAKFRTPKNP